MKYRRLGRAGVKVSEISLGTWILCDSLEEKRRAFEVIDQAYERGVNFFDTASSYAEGRAEAMLGEALSRHERSSYVVASKVYWPTGIGPNCRGLSRKHIFEQVHASLRRLRTDYIDLYYCHWFDPDTPVDETLRAFDDLVRQGKVLYIGVSNWTPVELAEGFRIVDEYLLNRIVAHQASYNMFDRHIEDELIDLCAQHGVGHVAFSPLAQGVLGGKYRRGWEPPEGSRARRDNIDAVVTVWHYLQDDILDAVEPLTGIARSLGLDLAQLALAWVLRQHNVASALVGASRPDQIDANAKAAGVTLPLEVQEDIKRILQSVNTSVKRTR